MIPRVVSIVVSLLALTWAWTAPAGAAFPDRDITLVVPWAAGGGTDTLARTLVKNGQKYFGVNINVVNRVGGNGVVGMDSVAKAKPDGYTVGVITFHLSAYRLIGLSDLIAFIEQPEVIRKILTHLGVWPAHVHSPPAGVPVAISPATGLIAA